jgi:hypothetical protein
MNEDGLAKRRAARLEHPLGLSRSSVAYPENSSVAYPENDESPAELRARLEALQNLLVDVADTLDDLKMHDLAGFLRRAAR